MPERPNGLSGTEETKVTEFQEEKFKLVIDYLREIMQQAQFAAVNIAIAANMASRDYGRESELGRTLSKLAEESADATRRVEELSKVAMEGLEGFDLGTLARKGGSEPKTMKQIENSFALILSDTKRVMDIISRLS